MNLLTHIERLIDRVNANQITADEFFREVRTALTEEKEIEQAELREEREREALNLSLMH